MDTQVKDILPKTVEAAETVVKETKGQSKKKIKAIVKLANSIIDEMNLSKKHKKLAKAAVKLLRQLI